MFPSKHTFLSLEQLKIQGHRFERRSEMKHRVRYVLFACVALLGAALVLEACQPVRRFFGRPVFVQAGAQPVAQKQAVKGNPQEDAAKEAIMANVRAFTEAYNKRDTK